MPEIRVLRKGDEGAVRTLILGILNREFSVDQKAYPLTDLEAIQSHYRGPRDTFLIAEVDHRIVGTVAVKEDDEKTALLRRIFVDSAHRGKGLGSRLVEQALAFCRKKGYRQVVFRGTARMEQALSLMRHKGFIEKERIPFGEVEMIHFRLTL